MCFPLFFECGETDSILSSWHHHFSRINLNTLLWSLYLNVTISSYMNQLDTFQASKTLLWTKSNVQMNELKWKQCHFSLLKSSTSFTSAWASSHYVCVCRLKSTWVCNTHFQTLEALRMNTFDGCQCQNLNLPITSGWRKIKEISCGQTVSVTAGSSWTEIKHCNLECE